MSTLREQLQANFFLLKRELRRRHKILTSKAFAGRSSRDSDNVVTLARIIGNDLYPRHADGQALRNLDFILENEPDFPNCRKVFILNRLFEPEKERIAAERIRARGHIALVLPFIDSKYAELVQRHDTTAEYPEESGNKSYFEGRRIKKSLLANADKIRYAININGARNRALQDGRAHGMWTVVLDGNCFVSSNVYAQLERDLFSRPVTPYVIIPMQRLESNDLALTLPAVPNRTEEPQIAFHRDSGEVFNEEYPYGLRDKTSLLARLRVPGIWSQWNRWEGYPVDSAPCPDRHHYKYATTCVFRLSSGVQGGTLEAHNARRKRYQHRNRAIFRTLSMLDERVS